MIPSAQRLEIKKAIKAAAPAQVDDGISHGTRQVFAVFTEPGSASGDRTLRHPIGVIGTAQEEYFTDVLFFYDDPHTIYDNWPKNVWTAIDAHEVLPA